MTEQASKSKTKRHHSDNETGAGMSPDAAHQMLGGSEVVSRSTFYSAIKAGQIPSLRCGRRRIIIPRAAFLKWLQGSGGLGA
jgi:excisionase family DNA binding protein